MELVLEVGGGEGCGCAIGGGGGRDDECLGGGEGGLGSFFLINYLFLRRLSCQ